ncbi:hypothetical protein CS063_01735 [Sporanaerobium hydrogeniformans]|uniref:Uncharacterized protein n=1 Tax=Sporanaerobium hydrogeniformans TaxID=3072179 RepID=A0AC61DH20_9FIRM|nr:copper amine oxidase N-terminal domain-containing protein [Sporanaerobium hydrogeniformans]PHV72222.1 hypothetical protein CS063_01735 [Sporanaerobium hydrogeniformans]
MRKIVTISLSIILSIGVYIPSYGQEEFPYYEFTLEQLYPELFEKAKEREAKPIEFYISGKLVPIPKEGPQLYRDKVDSTFFANEMQGEILVPVSYIRDGFGYQVAWNPKTQQIKFNNGEVKAYINQKEIEVGNHIIAIEHAPVLIDSRAYVSFKFLEQALGWVYTFDESGASQKYLFTPLDTLPALTDQVLATQNSSSNYMPLSVPIYAHSPLNTEAKDDYALKAQHFVAWEKLGSNVANVTTRVPGTPIHGDLEYLNSLVGKCGYGFAGDGQLTIGDKDTHIDTPRGHSDTYVAIGHSLKTDGRIVTIRGWVTDFNKKPSKGQIVQNNLSIEAIKYMSNSIEDGHAIIAYIDKYLNQKQYPPLDQNMRFGLTKVRFEKKAAGWGFHIIFND